jgi:uncharacterized protein YeaO (DUF488 family)
VLEIARRARQLACGAAALCHARAVVIKTKSVRSPVDAERDGLRVLVTRFRGRRVPRDRYDVWMANLGPSERLLRAFLGGEVSWRAYTSRYLGELFLPAAVDADNRTIKNHGQKFTLRLLKRLAERSDVTLLCHCDEREQHCHRHLLKRLLESKRI